LLIVILDNLRPLQNLLAAWREAGVPGVTILESAGAHRMGTWLSQVGLTAIDHLFESADLRRRTLLAAIDDESLLDRAVAEAERVVGNFEEPGTGVWLVVPLARAGGLHKIRREAGAKLPLPDLGSNIELRDTRVSDLPHALNLRPATVAPGTRLDEVGRAMLAQPDIHVVCVVAEDGCLVGMLILHAVVDNLLLHVLPEEFLAKIADLKGVMQFASISRMHTVADAMRGPVGIRTDDPMKDAFKRMHESHLSGLPVLAESNHVVGYVSLMTLLDAFLGTPAAPAPSHEETGQ
jgi:CBS domain-containing protein